MDRAGETLRIRTYAKVNLALWVGQAVPESGLHPICSWMHSIDLFDEIELSKQKDQRASHYSVGWAQGTELPDIPVEWEIDQDLSARAHRVIESHLGRLLNVQIRVSKKIPAGGGLGGGSSNAAGVLMGLNRLFDLGLDQRTLVGLAMELGSDVAFFVDPGYPIPRPAIVEGLGDEVTRLDQDHGETPITLILPGFGCHTGRVYGAFDAIGSSSSSLRSDEIKALALESTLDTHALFNDLTSAADQIAPDLGEIRETIRTMIGQPIHLSGSGSTMFVLGSLDPEVLEELGTRWRVIGTRLCSKKW